MRNAENISDVEALDVDFLGFIFYAGSPRVIPDNGESVTAIRGCLKPKVGVFVNESAEMIREKAALYQLDYLQLHGHESPAFCCELRQCGYSIIKAFSIASADDFKNVEKYSDCVDYLLFDTKCVGFGGSGKRFDWSLLHAYKGPVPFLLSGGLTPECMDDIRQLKHSKFAGIDLNSGFEIAPAVKDINTLRNFIADIRMLEINV